MVSVQRTGESIWRMSASLASAPVVTSFTSTLVTTGTVGSSNRTSFKISAIASRAGAISGEWKGAETGSSVTLRAPAAVAASIACATASRWPARTDWSGEFQSVQDLYRHFGWNKNTFLNEELTTIAFSGFPFNHDVPSAARPVLCPGPGAAIGVYCPPRAAMYDYTAPGSNLRRYDDDIPTYRLGANWSPGGNDDFIYAFAARGYKSGQPTLVDRVTGVSLSEPIRQEVVDSWEMGWKGVLGESGVYAELGYFYQDYTDMQLGAYTTTAVDSGGGTVNIGDVKIQGVESSLRANFGNFGLFCVDFDGKMVWHKRLPAMNAYHGTSCSPLPSAWRCFTRVAASSSPPGCC